MTQEEKELLLKDLCERLPYGVKVYCGEGLAMTLRQIDYQCFCESWENEDIKSHSRWKLPYLRPMSSMTEEEKKELAAVCGVEYIDDKIVDFGEFLCEGSPINIKNIYGLFDWLNAHHFDYRGLIEKGFALEAQEGMYNTKTE